VSQLPEERAIVISKLRSLIQENIPEGFTEEMSYGMIGYIVPHSLYSEGYHCDPSLPLPFINIASQKNFIAFYHIGMYADKNLYDWFVAEYPKHCSRKLDMGKSCIRFKKKTDDIPYELLAKLVRKMTVLDWVSLYEEKLKK
jgi:uncharacterized protein YdhG (YjbR/CyaY superfamily)